MGDYRSETMDERQSSPSAASITLPVLDTQGDIIGLSLVGARGGAGKEREFSWLSSTTIPAPPFPIRAPR